MLVTIPATLDAVSGELGLAVTCRIEGSGTLSLLKIETKNEMLLFAPREASGGN